MSPQVFVAHVFNAEQIEGVPLAPSRECSWDPLERAEQLVQAANPKLQHGAGDRAYYRPSTDSIHLPLKEQFHRTLFKSPVCLPLIRRRTTYSIRGNHEAPGCVGQQKGSITIGDMQ